jgi:hypothetical protein
MNKEVELGDEVKCKVTGWQGVVTSLAKCLTGCDRAAVRAPITKDGKMGEEYWLDVPALTIIKKAKLKPESVQAKDITKKGGPPVKTSWR